LYYFFFNFTGAGAVAGLTGLTGLTGFRTGFFFTDGAACVILDFGGFSKLDFEVRLDFDCCC
jgi:hypothetical protein